MILDQIKKANIEALKEKNTLARNFYSVVLNKIKLEEIKRREGGEEINDTAVIAILQKTIKELNEEQENYKKAGNQSAATEIEMQKELASKYLPQMMSKAEIRNIINGMADKSIPAVMKHFKENFAGKCDMREVSEVLKEI